MTKYAKTLLHLVVAIGLAVVAVGAITFATIRSCKYGKNDFSHNIAVEEIVLNNEQSKDDMLCHDVTLCGEARNTSGKDYTFATMEIVLAGVNNITGEYEEFVFCKELSDFADGTKKKFADEKFSILSMSGYIPEAVKEVRVVSNGDVFVATFEQPDDLYLICFAFALGLAVAACLVFGKWNKLRKTAQN